MEPTTTTASYDPTPEPVETHAYQAQDGWHHRIEGDAPDVTLHVSRYNSACHQHIERHNLDGSTHPTRRAATAACADAGTLAIVELPTT